MKGTTWDSLKRYPSLVPLYFVMALGVTAATLYPLRCALRAPEVTWNRVKNPEPWNEYSNKDYKLYTVKSVKDLNLPPPPTY